MWRWLFASRTCSFESIFQTGNPYYLRLTSCLQTNMGVFIPTPGCNKFLHHLEISQGPVTKPPWEWLLSRGRAVIMTSKSQTWAENTVTTNMPLGSFFTSKAWKKDLYFKIYFVILCVEITDNTNSIPYGDQSTAMGCLFNACEFCVRGILTKGHSLKPCNIMQPHVH